MSLLGIFYWLVLFSLILGPFRGGGGKTKLCGQDFYGHPDFSDILCRLYAVSHRKASLVEQQEIPFHTTPVWRHCVVSRGSRRNCVASCGGHLRSQLHSSWATPKPKYNRPSHPHVLSWAFFCPRDSEARPSNSEPIALVLKCRLGVRGSNPGTPGIGHTPRGSYSLKKRVSASVPSRKPLLRTPPRTLLRTLPSSKSHYKEPFLEPGSLKRPLCFQTY